MIKIKLLLLIGLQNIFFKDATVNDLRNANKLLIIPNFHNSTLYIISSNRPQNLLKNYSTFDENSQINSKQNREYILKIEEFCKIHNIKNIEIDLKLKYFREILETNTPHTINIQYIGTNLIPIYIDQEDKAFRNEDIQIKIKEENDFFKFYKKYLHPIHINNPQENEFQYNQYKKVDIYITTIKKTFYNLQCQHQFFKENHYPYNHNLINILDKKTNVAIDIYETYIQNILEKYTLIINNIIDFEKTNNKAYLFEAEKNMKILRDICYNNKKNISIQDDIDTLIHNPNMDKNEYIKYIFEDINKQILLYKEEENNINILNEKINLIVFDKTILSQVSIQNLLQIFRKIYNIIEIDKTLNTKKNFNFSQIQSDLDKSESKIPPKKITYEEYLKSQLLQEEIKITKI